MSSLAKIIHESEESLEKVGFTREQAKAQVEVYSTFIDSQYTTKRDLKDVEASLKRDLKELEIKLDSKMSEQKLELIKWIIGVGVAQASIVLSVIKFVH